MAKSDADRGPIGAWMRRERVARGWTDLDMANELAKRGVHILPASYRGYEAGPRPPSSQVRQALEAVFGSSAPDTKKEVAEPPQLSDLIGAIYAQTAAISELVSVLRQTEGIPSIVAEKLVDELTHDMPLVDEGVRADTGEPPDSAGTGQPQTT